MLSLRAVNQFYGSQHTLWNVDLDFPQGMCTGVVGLPGMGKTTLMNCIAGKVPVDSGTIIWHEAGAPPRDLLSQTAEQRSGPGIGYVPQDRRIFSQLTIEENLHIAMRAMDNTAKAPTQVIITALDSRSFAEYLNENSDILQAVLSKNNAMGRRA